MSRKSWKRFARELYVNEELGLSLEIGGMGLGPSERARLAEPLARALDRMEALEGGSVANPDEGRQVGHYWLRDPALAPDGVGQEIEQVWADVVEFATAVRQGRIRSERGWHFRRLLHIGIGGSALGPQLLADALDRGRGGLRPHFLDNTDPDGIDRVLAEIGNDLDRTLVLTVSKSGGTKETLTGLREAQAAYGRAGLAFAAHGVAITGEGSVLDQEAVRDRWLARLPMWDWVGGRTSVTSAVGLFPLALLGGEVEAFLQGAREMDRATRGRVGRHNPAVLLAACWTVAGNGRGDKQMVVLPYKDRLVLFPRYLQQLVMESLGKRLDRRGREVCQGLTVFGNKGSTDQHAYVQQLRDGRDDFFVTFIEVLRDRAGQALEVEPGVTAGDYLHGFLHGTRQALASAGRGSLTLTLEQVDARRLGALIALFERAVGLYAELCDLNAYHQPGVEAGKRAAAEVLALQQRLLAHLRANPDQSFTVDDLDADLGSPGQHEAIFGVLRHLAANPGRGVVMERGVVLSASRFRAEEG